MTSRHNKETGSSSGTGRRRAYYCDSQDEYFPDSDGEEFTHTSEDDSEFDNAFYSDSENDKQFAKGASKRKGKGITSTSSSKEPRQYKKGYGSSGRPRADDYDIEAEYADHASRSHPGEDCAGYPLHPYSNQSSHHPSPSSKSHRRRVEYDYDSYDSEDYPASKPLYNSAFEALTGTKHLSPSYQAEGTSSSSRRRRSRPAQSSSRARARVHFASETEVFGGAQDAAGSADGNQDPPPSYSSIRRSGRRHGERDYGPVHPSAYSPPGYRDDPRVPEGPSRVRRARHEHRYVEEEDDDGLVEEDEERDDY